MKRAIKIKSSRIVSGSNKKLIYQAEDGNSYIGPPIEFSYIMVEISENQTADGHYQIIKVIGPVGRK